MVRHDGGRGEEGAEVLAEGRGGHHLAAVGDEHRQQEDHQQPLAEAATGGGAGHPRAWMKKARLSGVSRIMMVAVPKLPSSNQPG